MSQIDEPKEYQSKTIHDEVFLDHCLDLYDVIRYGTRKERKYAAQELVVLAAAMKDAFVDADNKLKEVELKLHKLDAPPPEGRPAGKEGAQAADVPAAPSDPDINGEKANCVIGEYAHGDDPSWYAPHKETPDETAARSDFKELG
jgi:hypothetical protein